MRFLKDPLIWIGLFTLLFVGALFYSHFFLNLEFSVIAQIFGTMLGVILGSFFSGRFAVETMNKQVNYDRDMRRKEILSNDLKLLNDYVTFYNTLTPQLKAFVQPLSFIDLEEREELIKNEGPVINLYKKEFESMRRIEEASYDYYVKLSSMNSALRYVYAFFNFDQSRLNELVEDKRIKEFKEFIDTIEEGNENITRAFENAQSEYLKIRANWKV